MGALTVPGSGLVYLDANPLIYSVEKHPVYWPLLEPLWQAAKGKTIEIFTLVIQEGQMMSVTIAGFVKNGVVVPNAPLPEGAFVEVHVIRGPIEVPPELQAELDAWQLAGADALALVERLAREGEADEKG